MLNCWQLVVTMSSKAVWYKYRDCSFYPAYAQASCSGAVETDVRSCT